MGYVFPDSKLEEGVSLQMFDWHNHTQEALDKAKKGPGEQGLPHYLPPDLEEKREELFQTNGFNALLSDYISLSRALPDIRHPKFINIWRHALL
ncbi:Polypeptide N-acetylgalactosaminyltransferase 10 [Portunus trituberculatus]|uniref:Polypeptide N-acetylgalactosaminyltransferase 10 n=1 Tax=Portunus trituberculatus TaxID=210409 RepID=A0A5B7CE77_PORTR|nr:Polypeptide N-acetylgalactosaminyltransferase 10 [Portunus trituberculatus]